jgi:hypothetical protein
MLVGRSARWALAFGAVLAIITLGGDPQMAYHAGLLATLYAWLLWREQRRRRHLAAALRVRNTAPPESTSGPASRNETTARNLPHGRQHWLRGLLGHRLTLLTIAAASGILLAAVQILPAVEWTRHSDRAAYHAPRNIYEASADLIANATAANSSGERNSLPSSESLNGMNSVLQTPSVWSSIGKGLAGSPQPGTHHEYIYMFSVGPWRLPELVWPNFSGRMFPVHRRWTSAIPAEGSVWSPSLYMGLLPLLLAFSRWRLIGGHVRQRWLSWSVVLAVLGSLGWYGIGWLIHEVRHAWGDANGDPLLGQPFGGLYWLMVVTLPGYVYFRFPAKLLVVAALALSLLAAEAWDRTFTGRTRGLRIVLLILGAVSLAGIVVVLAVQPFWSQWMSHAPPDDLLGPLSASGAAQDLLVALLHTAILCGVLWWLLGRITSRAPRYLAPTVLLITALDLAIANAWMVPSAPQQIWNETPAIANAIGSAEQDQPGDNSFRIYRGSEINWWPRHWPTTSSATRQVEGVGWDRDTLFPKYHLRPHVSLVESSGTLMSQDYQMVLQVARQYGPVRPDGISEPHPMVLDALATKYVLLPDDFAYPHGALIDNMIQRTDGSIIDNVSLWRNPGRYPRAWIVHRIETLHPLATNDPVTVERRTQQVFFPGHQPRDLRQWAVVEAARRVEAEQHTAQSRLLNDELGQNVQHAQSSDAPRPESCRIILDEPQHVEIDVHLAAPGLVVLSDLHYPGWNAEVTTAGCDQPRPLRILRTNRMMRGVYLPAGNHRIVYRYRPRSFLVGASISALAWLALIIAAACSVWRRP